MKLKDELNQIRNFLYRAFRMMAEHVLCSFLVLIFPGLIFAGSLFYQYGIAVKKAEPEATERHVYFKEKLYQEILEKWEEREKGFKKIDSKAYLNPFSETREPLETQRKEEAEGLEAEEELEGPSKTEPEPPSKLETEQYQEIKNLFEFYGSRGEELPSVEERARLWEEMGLGKAEEYLGSYSQNARLLKELLKMIKSDKTI